MIFPIGSLVWPIAIWLCDNIYRDGLQIWIGKWNRDSAWQDYTNSTATDSLIKTCCSSDKANLQFLHFLLLRCLHKFHSW